MELDKDKSLHLPSEINAKPGDSGHKKLCNAFSDLENSLYIALETYSNVHRGSGHFSVVTTHLYEFARNIVLEYLDLSKNKYCVIFCTLARSEQLIKSLEPESFYSLSAKDIGLPIGVRALAVIKKSLPHGVPFQTGGGTARLVSPDYVVWAGTPDKFEAGTPAIINIIAFAQALRLILQYGSDSFKSYDSTGLCAQDILYYDEFEDLSGAELLSALRPALIGAGKKVPTNKGLKPFINLDNAASTPTFTPVLSVFNKTLRCPPQIQKNIIDKVKAICSSYLGAPLSFYNIIFTSNTTEAINIVADNLKLQINSGYQPVVLNTLLEHNSNELPWRSIPGCSLLKLSLNEEGFVDIHEMETLLDSYNNKCLYGSKRIKLVAVTAVSNVLGVCNDLESISRIVHRYDAHLLVDAAQLVAHRKINIEEVDIDYFAFSAHKAYAPFGSGALLIKKGLLNLSYKATELLRNSGEENSAGIAALGKSFILLQKIGLELVRQEEQDLTSRLLKGLSQIPEIRLFCHQGDSTTVPVNKGGVISFAINGINPHKVAKLLAELGGIGVRSGCHCSHILIKHLLKIPRWAQKFQRIFVILFPKIELPGLVRISMGIENTEAEIDTCISVLKEIALSKKEKTPYPVENIKQQIEDFIQTVKQKVYLYTL
jgi:selenocysteine lyase/cysteine desulfurase